MNGTARAAVVVRRAVAGVHRDVDHVLAGRQPQRRTGSRTTASPSSRRARSRRGRCWCPSTSTPRGVESATPKTKSSSGSAARDGDLEGHRLAGREVVALLPRRRASARPGSRLAASPSAASRRVRGGGSAPASRAALVGLGLRLCSRPPPRPPPGGRRRSPAAARRRAAAGRRRATARGRRASRPGRASG